MGKRLDMALRHTVHGIRDGAKLTTTNLLDIWQPDLRQHVVDTAKRLTRNRKIQKDLVGHAWFKLGEADAQKTEQFYRRYVTLCMEKRYLLIVYKEVYIT